MENYAALSLETHLFFARIMKEHALFLEAGFPGKEKEWIDKAEWFRREFEEFLRRVVKISDGMIGEGILKSGEIVTRFTIPAEERTCKLTGISIDSEISERQLKLCSGHEKERSREIFRMVHQLNEKAINLLNDFIQFKENILKEVRSCCLFTANYPLLIEHITREAKLYRSTLMELRQNRNISCRDIRGKEIFWNQIMMEHALFIRGLLDPCEEKLIRTADNFASEFKELLEMAREQDCRVSGGLTGKTLKETLKYRDFKASGAEGILDGKIESIILPLLADHVLREANHYIRILKQKY